MTDQHRSFVYIRKTNENNTELSQIKQEIQPEDSVSPVILGTVEELSGSTSEDVVCVKDEKQDPLSGHVEESC